MPQAALAAPASTQPTTLVGTAAHGAAEDRALLAAQCDQAIAAVVRTSYGWAWSAEAGDTPADGPAGPGVRGAKPPIAVDAMATAAIGIHLLWAGEILGEDQYKQAAVEAGRGLASLQLPTGQVRARAVFGKPGGGPREPAAEIPDRRATRAALALWLTLLDATPSAPPAPRVAAEAPRRDERLTRPAAAAAHWLERQQAPGGMWPSAYAATATSKAKPERLILLDNSECRESSIALLMAADVLDDSALRTASDRAMATLLDFRAPTNNKAARVLWMAAYQLDGEPADRKFPTLPQGIDLSASRYALEIVLANYLMTLKVKPNDALADAASAIAGLPKVAGQWHRNYDRRGNPIADTGPTTRDVSPFEPLPPAPREPAFIAPLGRLMTAIGRIGQMGGAKYVREMEAGFPLRRRLTLLMCGISDDALLGRPTLVETGVDPRVEGLWAAYSALVFQGAGG